VTVTLADGRRLDGKLLAKDLRTGLAVVKVDARDLPAVKLAAKSPPAGSLVVTVSHPAGLGSTVRLGMVSATDRSVTGLGPDIVGATQYSGLLQITTPVSAPDLGGLVVDLDGNMVAMIHGAMTGRASVPRRVLRQEGGVQVFQVEPSGEATVQGVSFAMPVEVVAPVFAALQKGEKMSWGYLGIYFGVEAGKGLLVKDVVADGPAKAAGVRPGDVIRSADVPGRERLTFTGEARDLEAFQRLVAWTKPGTALTLGVRRDGGDVEVKVTLGTAPEMPEQQAMVLPPDGLPFDGGPEMEKLLEELRRGMPAAAPDETQLGVMTEPAPGGVRLAGVLEGTPAEKAGLRAGDVILRVDDVRVQNPVELHNELQKHKPGDKLSIALQRDGRDMVVEVTLDRPRQPVVRVRRFPQGAFLGIEGEDTADGLRVKRVVEDSPAAAAGLKEGDIILRADRKDLAGLNDLREIIRGHKPDDALAMIVRRDGREMDVNVKLGTPPTPAFRMP
ncbi:MAG TPA: PDZ domain-containing protein, partial [Planctomycetota bacterium]|nr:PDZ domain-containing protein [Planctomycetota bacterium]